jgi:hypothetical protein
MDEASAKKWRGFMLGVVVAGCAVLAVHTSARGDGSLIALGMTLVSAPVCVVAAVSMLRYRRHRGRAAWPAIIGAIVSFGIVLSVACTQWPLRVSFALSRKSLDGLATRVGAGEQVATPARAGFFTVREAEVSRRGVVCLWTNEFSTGRVGFVRRQPDGVPGNAWSNIWLNETWQFIEED